MKISNSKKELARIISENGGWRDGAEFSVQNGEHGRISFSTSKPVRHDQKSWMAKGGFQFKIEVRKPLPNWHQTVLSREEYFHLYPATDADGWIEWRGGECPVDVGTIVDVKHRDGDIGTRCHAGMRSSEPDGGGPATAEDWSHLDEGGDIIAYRLHKPEKAIKAEKLSDEAVLAAKSALMGDSIEEFVRKQTIEQLAADYRNAKDYAERKQKEADAAKADAEATLAELIAAGEALGLVLSVVGVAPEPELVITDWRDLQLGDVIEYADGDIKDKIGMTGPVVELAKDDSDGMPVRLKCDNGPDNDRFGWPRKWRFIRRPSKAAPHA